jgi:DNA polymerase zeta
LCRLVARLWRRSDDFAGAADLKAIEVIHSKHKWGAEVVYGDTDSLFVYLPGKTREEAFNIGEDIAETITRMNPRPIKLKFEKVISH